MSEALFFHVRREHPLIRLVEHESGSQTGTRNVEAPQLYVYIIHAEHKKRKEEVADETCHNPLNDSHRNTHDSCVELPNTVTYVSLPRVRECSGQTLCSLLGEFDNKASLVI